MTSDSDEDRDDDGLGTQLDIEEVAHKASKVAAVYTRQDTPEAVSQSVDVLLTHTETELGYRFREAVRTEIVNFPKNNSGDFGVGGEPAKGFNGVVVYHDTTDTFPEGVDACMRYLNRIEATDVVVPTLATLGSVDSATRRVESLQDTGVTTHLIDDGLIIQSDDQEVRDHFAAVRRAAKSNGDTSLVVTEQGTGVEWDSGQPPVGFDVNSSGYLVRNENWETIRRAARAVETGEMTLYRTSQITDFSRHAIRTALKKHYEMYRVDEAAPLTTGDGTQE